MNKGKKTFASVADRDAWWDRHIKPLAPKCSDTPGFFTIPGHAGAWVAVLLETVTWHGFDISDEAQP